VSAKVRIKGLSLENKNENGLLYKVRWDMGNLDCRDSNIQKGLGMTLEQIINADEDYLEDKMCRLYSLPQIVSKSQLKSLLRNGRRGFKIWHYQECN